MKEYKQGDWVRFYREGVLVIAVVEYVRFDTLKRTILSTDQGEIPYGYVLEVRRVAEFIKGDD